jgi:hypothetical protein
VSNCVDCQHEAKVNTPLLPSWPASKIAGAGKGKYMAFLEVTGKAGKYAAIRLSIRLNGHEDGQWAQGYGDGEAQAPTVGGELLSEQMHQCLDAGSSGWSRTFQIPSSLFSPASPRSETLMSTSLI